MCATLTRSNAPSQPLRAQEIVILKIPPAQFSISESPISSKVSIIEYNAAAMPKDSVADDRSASNDRTATVPPAVTRVVTIHKRSQLLLLAPASTASLGKTRCWN